MRLTVGPLPAAVYWRRRSVVLGGLLIVVFVVVYACGGAHPSNAAGGNHLAGGEPSSGPSGSPTDTAPVAPSTVVTPATTPPVSESSAPATSGTCTDAEMQVRAVISTTSTTTGKLQYGGTFTVKLQIANISARTCTRDVGSVPEELRIEQGSTKIWSSDDCVTASGKAHDTRTFHPGDAITAQVKWSSYDITTTTCVKSTTPAAAGSYELVGRLGTKLSAPTKFTIAP